MRATNVPRRPTPSVAPILLSVAVAGLLLANGGPWLVIGGAAHPSGSVTAPPPTGPSSAPAGPATAALEPVIGTYVPRATSPVVASETPVNPYAFFTREPAPMGIADFGIGPNGVAYRYTTPEFEGTLQLVKDHAQLQYAQGGYTAGSNDVTFQLNVVLLLVDGARSMQFWVQDALFLNSTSHGAIFGNNVWNFSSGSSGVIQSNSVVGNGSDYYGVYEDFAQNGYPGSNVTLPYPVNITTRVVASSINNVPHVGLAYDDGSGFVTYDNISFPWARGWTTDGFVVDGTGYNPLGIFDDAEWDYDGPGNRASAENVVSNLTLGLEYWNGHNLQSVVNAYNFGSDTGETTYNVVAALAAPSAGVTPYARLGNGSGSLGMVYNRTTIALVNVSSPAPNGTLVVSGRGVPFVGGHLNLTLAPGNYTLELTNATGTIGTVAVSLAPGEYLPVAFHPRPLPQRLTIQETGLPAGTMFSVVVNGTFNDSSAGSIGFSLLNGSYAYDVATIAGWELTAPYHGIVQVNGSTLLAFVWQLATFPVTSTAVNLPAGVPWTLTIAGVTREGGTASFVLPNGTYDYAVSVGIVYLAEPDNGSVTVAGAATVVTVQFGLDPGTLIGSVDPSNASVTVGGSSVAVQGGLFTVTLVPGEYQVVVSAPGWNTTSRNITVTAGNTSLASFDLGPASGPPSHHGSPGSNGSGSGGGSGLSAIEFLGIAAAVTAIAIAGAALLARRPRPPRARPRPPSG